MRIYIVDDDSETRVPEHYQNFNNIKLYLELEGHDVTSEGYLEKAFNHLAENSNKYRYDLIIVDHHFYPQYQSGRFINGQNEKEQDNGTGAFLCGELSKLNLLTPIVLFTATGKDPDNIRKVLGEYGITYFLEKRELNNDAILKITKLPGFNRIWTIRQIEIEKELNNYFEKLTSDERELMRNNLLWFIDNKEVKIKTGKYLLKDLFSNPNQVSTKTSLSSQLLKYLNRNENYFLDGGLATIEYNKAITRYKNNSEYETSKKQIDLDALNYLLDILSVLEKYKEAEDGKLFLLNEKHRRYKATKDTSVVNWEVLREKLILRRVALGLDKLNMFVEKITEDLKSRDTETKINYKKVIAALLRHGDTCVQTQTKNKQELNPTHVFKYGLGLVSNQHDRTNHSFCAKELEEEVIWVNTFAKATKYIRAFLDKAIKDEEFQSYISPNDSFVDLNEFWEFFKRTKTIYEKEDDNIKFTKFIEQIKDYFETNSNQFTSSLIFNVLTENNYS